MNNLFYKKIRKLNSATNLLVTILLTVIAVAVNYSGAILAEKFVIPLYLDTILTIAIAAICGFVPAVICAFCSSFALSLFSQSPAIFSICHIITALLASLVFWYYDNKKEFAVYPIYCFLWAGFWSALSNGLVGDIIAYFVFRGNTGRPSANVVVQGIYSAWPNLAFATNFGGLLENIADKILSAVLSYLLYRLVSYFCKEKLFR